MKAQFKPLLAICSIVTVFSLSSALSGCVEADVEIQNTEVASAIDPTLEYTREDLDAILADPIARSELIVKIMGTTERADTHAYLYFHVYGFSGEGNLVPLFTMHNYIVQKWTPVERGTYNLQHYEVAYYADFNTQEPVGTWVNPITNIENDLPTLILGPIQRQYTPDGIIAPGVAPNPLNVSLIGDRIFIPTQSTDKIPNPLASDEWGQYSIGPTIFWDSMLTYSADLSEVLNPENIRAPAEIHMQNLVSWSPNLQMGRRPGRSMVRAFGQHIDGPEDIPKNVYDNLVKHSPEIFDTDNWTDFRMDTIDYLKELQEKRTAGELDIKPLN